MHAEDWCLKREKGVVVGKNESEDCELVDANIVLGG